MKDVLKAGVLLSLLVWGFIVFASPAMFAQATEGVILGTVTDAQSAVIMGANVEIASVETGYRRRTATDESGNYLVPNVPIGNYLVTANYPGFKTTTSSAINITVKARARVDLQLQVGKVEEVVEVTAAAPLIKTDTTEVSTVVSRNQLQSLPLVGRHFLNLSVLTPGTVRQPTGRLADLGGDAMVAGASTADQNNFILDGVSNNMLFSGTIGVAPAPDAIEEFSVQTSGYSAEFGQAGGAIVNVAMRSGTNDLHGFAYDYLRNDKLNARPYDFSGTTPEKQPLRRNQFGAGAGFPIIRNKLFLFANYDGIRQPSSTIRYVVTPTDLERTGDFSQSGYDIFDPATQHADPNDPDEIIRDQFPGNQIPASRVNSLMERLTGEFPSPNYLDPRYPSVLSNYLAFQPNADTTDSINLKTDLLMSQQDTLTARWSQQWVDRERTGFMKSDYDLGNGELDAANGGLTYTRVMTPSFVNELRVGYNQLLFGNTIGNATMVLDEGSVPGANIKPGFPNLSIRRLTSPRPIRALTTLPNPFLNEQHSWPFMDTVAWQAGNHSIKFGGEFSRHSIDTSGDAPGGIEPSFAARYTTEYVGGAREFVRTGLADGLLGLSDEWETYYYNDKTRLRGLRSGLFFQDEWRAHRKLHLSLGVRYDWMPHWGERGDQLTGFDLVAGQILVPEKGRDVLIDYGVPNGELPPTMRYAPIGDVLPRTDFVNFGPRLGFAYAATDRLVLRGGYGIFYGTERANPNNNTAGTPFSATINMKGDLDAPVDISQGFPANGYADVVNAPFPEISQLVELDHSDPYIQKWNLNVQFSPFPRTAMEVGYNASHGVAFPSNMRFNYPTPGPGAIQPRRPYPEFGEGFAVFYVGDSSYNALEVTVRQREIAGLSVFSTFTWSKALGVLNGGGMQISNVDYYTGRLSTDYGRRWVTSFIYRIPIWSNAGRLARTVLGDWQASSIILLQGGFPFSVLSEQPLNDDLDFSRANLLLDHGAAELPSGQRSIDRWFNTAAFATPAAYTFGNSGQNILNGPGTRNIDFAIQKTFVPREALNVTFRMEATNFFNTVNWGQPGSTLPEDGNVEGSNFGVIRSTSADQRVLQFSLRLSF